MFRASAVAFCVAFATGCTSRDLTVTSSPDGAEVYLDRQPAGTTPVTIPFRYGGIRELFLLREGFQPTSVLVDTERLAFDVFPLDAFVDLTPIPSEDHQQIHVTLTASEDIAGLPRYEIDDRVASLLERADALRSRINSARESAAPASVESR